MMQHLPILQVILPLLAAPLAALASRRHLAWLLTLVATAGAFAISLVLLATILRTGAPILYDLGGWPAPIGIVYVIDPGFSKQKVYKSMVSLKSGPL